MTKAGLADHKNISPDEQRPITRATVLKLFAIIAAVSFLLRVAYAGHLYEDDGLWFTAAEELVRGRMLYSEIYFDKPPGLALVYALLFWIFGAHIIVIRVFTIAYSVAIAAVIYLFGSRLYDKRTGLVASAMFAVFSTTYVTGHVQSLSTDLLMALPYTAGAYLMCRSVWKGNAWLAAAGGALAGLGFQINPKTIFDLIFFGVVLIAARRWARRKNGAADAESSLDNSPGRLFALAGAGFAAGVLPFFAYVAATGSLRPYWLYVWDWGSRYSAYYGAGRTVLTALTRTADYLALNNTLLIAVGFVVVTTLRRVRRSNDTTPAPAAGFRKLAILQSDVTLLIWLAVSYAGVMIGGRFFGHYFIQLLPALCLIGARGLTAILASLGGRTSMLRRGVIALLALGFAFTLVRFHGRGVLLAADSLRGTVSATNANWYYNQRAREERTVAAVVRDLSDDSIAADSLGLEAIRAGGPRTSAAEKPADYLFVWGYRPEIYFWSGLLPASRFLSTQPLTGVPADVHYFGDDYRSLLDPAVTAQARMQLVGDLEETQPKYIVDEIGFFNSDLAILQYAELRAFMGEYKSLGATGRFFIYRRKGESKKYRLRHNREEQ